MRILEGGGVGMMGGGDQQPRTHRERFNAMYCCFPSLPWKCDSAKMGKPHIDPFHPSPPPAACPPLPPIYTPAPVSTPAWNNILVRQQDCGLQGGMLSGGQVRHTCMACSAYRETFTFLSCRRIPTTPLSVTRGPQ